jgi:glycosyltransferase involved in cell wall biosynthesis
MPDSSDLVRVLIVHPRDPAAPTIGGIQTFLRDFIKYAPPDFAISFVGTTRDPQARPVGNWMSLDISGRRIRFLAVGESSGLARSPVPLWRTFKGFARLWQALRVRDRILQVHRPYREFVLNQHRGPTVQFIHLDLRDWPGPDGWPRLRTLYREFSDSTLEQMDRVFIVNEPGAVILRDEHPAIAQRVEFLPVWFDTDVFRPATDEQRAVLRDELAATLGLDSAGAADTRYVLLAVRLTDIKKPLLAIETLAELARRGRDGVHLLVAGAGELLGDMRNLTDELGLGERVHFLGDLPREQIARLMQSSDALLLTARSEGGGPRVVVEGLACGLPVVSTTVVEVRRTVTTGVNGWLVDDVTPAALADGLEWALDQPREDLVPAAVAAVERFTAEKILAGLYDTYRMVATGGDAGGDSGGDTAA